MLLVKIGHLLFVIEQEAPYFFGNFRFFFAKAIVGVPVHGAIMTIHDFGLKLVRVVSCTGTFTISRSLAS
jgi:hypothetical protein